MKQYRNLYLFPILLIILSISSSVMTIGYAQDIEATVKVATIHFCPALGKVEQNVQDLLVLNREAAQNGAKIIVNTEMATSGYSFFSRAEIAKVAETIPGPTTAAFGKVAKTYGIYIVLGMPEYDKQTKLYYNAAVLIGPNGNVLGIYHKRNNMLEASYNAIEFGPIPAFDTPYGRIGIAICADVFYPQIPRLAALKGVDILAVPMNSGGETDYFKVLCFENDFSIIVANRYGEETKGETKHIFNQDTFTIPSAYPYSFNYGSHSVIITNRGKILADIAEQHNSIGYGTLPVLTKNCFPVYRHPQLYSLIAQDTLQPYLLKQMALPPAGVFAAAAVDPQNKDGSWEIAINAMTTTVNTALSKGYNLRLLVLPADYFKISTENGIAMMKDFCLKNKVDVVLHFGEVSPPVSMLITSSGETYVYKRTHRGVGEKIPDSALSNEFLIIDRDYARLALLQDKDLFAPETGIVMAKMGVDVIAVNSNSSKDILTPLWQAQTANYLHLVVANLSGKEGIYLGGYKASPSYEEAEGTVIMNINTGDVRNKVEQRFIDASPMTKSF
jgi:predicted amidohydrolase